MSLSNACPWCLDAAQERGFTISPLNRAQNTQKMVSSLPWVLHIGILVLNSGMPARSRPCFLWLTGGQKASLPPVPPSRGHAPLM